MNLTRNFQLWEFEYSDTARQNGVRNIASERHIRNLKLLAENVLQPLRDEIGKPIKVTSGYRNDALNKLVGGSPTSQHSEGEAADIKIEEMTGRDIANVILSEAIPFDQMVIYPKFLHVSYRAGRLRHVIVPKD